MEDLNLNKCIICIEDILTDIEYLPCAHSFHKECIDEWIKTVKTCPICKIPIYIDSPEHLTLYNYYKTIEDAESEAESRFFHQVSSGMFDQSVGNLNPTTQPPQSSLNLPSFNEIVENRLENRLENRSENRSENRANSLENSLENRLENIIVLNADNLDIFNSFIDVLASAVNHIDYVNIIDDENLENDN